MRLGGSRRSTNVEDYRSSPGGGRPGMKFGLGTIAMATSDESTPLAIIACIPASRAKELREEIRNLVEDLRDRKRVREIDYA